MLVIFVFRESVYNTFIIQQHWNQKEDPHNLSGRVLTLYSIGLAKKQAVPKSIVMSVLLPFRVGRPCARTSHAHDNE